MCLSLVKRIMKKLKGLDGKLDDICRELCKERADWTCERCLNVEGEGWTGRTITAEGQGVHDGTCRIVVLIV